MEEYLKWADMGARERLFAAYYAIMFGHCIAFAEACVRYYPHRDVVAFDPGDSDVKFTNHVASSRVQLLHTGFKVELEGSESAARIRHALPGYFPTEQSALDCVLGDG